MADRGHASTSAEGKQQSVQNGGKNAKLGRFVNLSYKSMSVKEQYFQCDRFWYGEWAVLNVSVDTL